MNEHGESLPVTVADAVDRTKRGRGELEALISSLSEEQLTAPGPELWSIKDHLSHLDIWSRALQDLLDGKPRFPRFLVSSPEEMHSIPIDDINDRLFRTYRDQLLEDVLAGLRENHQGTIDRLLAMSDADLARPYSSYVAEDHPHGHEAIVNWI